MVSNWSAQRVAEWLRSEGFGNHADLFLSEDITGEVLLELSNDELRQDLGVIRLGDRHRILKAIERLRLPHPVEDRAEERPNAIEGSREEILATIQRSRVTIVVAPTGCGKSVSIPQMLLEEPGGEGRRVLCTQPRRVAATSLARRVADLRGVELGSEVGYQIRGLSEVARGGASRLVYATTAVAVQQLLQECCTFTHLVVDEVHIRDIWIDFLLTLLAMQLERGDHELRIVLMSAAMDHDAVENYFNRYLRGSVTARLDLQMLRRFPLKESYLEDFPYFESRGVAADWTRLPCHPDYLTAAWSQEEVADIIGGFILDLHDSRSKRTAVDGSLAFESFIVFLAGRREIEMLAQRLDQDGRTDLDVKAVFGGQTIEAQEHLLRTCAPEEVRSVFLATDVIESSITIPDVDLIIDTCEHKRFWWDRRRKQSFLALMRVSRDEAKQRAGRAGRCRPGEVIRLISRDDFDKLGDHVKPATLNSRLDTIVLNAFSWSVRGNPRDFLLKMPEAPSEERVDAAVARLMELNALRRTFSAHGPVLGTTCLGKLLVRMPLDPEAGSLVMNGVRLGLALKCTIMAAVHERGDPFLSNSDWGPGQVHPLFYARDACSPGRASSQGEQAWPSDLVVGMRAYEAWRAMAEKVRGTGWTLAEQEHWCTNHFLSFSRLHEIDVEVIEIFSVLEELGLTVHEEIPQWHRTEMQKRQREMASAQSRQSGVHWCGPTGLPEAATKLGELLQPLENHEEDLLIVWCLAASFIHGLCETKWSSCGESVMYKPRHRRDNEVEGNLRAQGFEVIRADRIQGGVLVRFADCKEAHRAVQTAALSTNRGFPWQRAYPWYEFTNKRILEPRKCYSGGVFMIVTNSLVQPPPTNDVTIIAAAVTPMMSQKQRSTTFIGSKCSIAPRGILPLALYATYKHRDLEINEIDTVGEVWKLTASFEGVQETLIYRPPDAEVHALLDDIRTNFDKEFDLLAAAFITRREIMHHRRRAVLRLMQRLVEPEPPPMPRVG